MSGTRFSRASPEGAPADDISRGSGSRDTGVRPSKRRRAGGDDTSTPSGVPGGDADKPTQIPAGGWLQIVKRGWAEAKADQVPLLGAGVAFYAFLALFPAIIALVTLYGLFADPATIVQQVNSLGAFPAEVRQLIVGQVESRNQTALGFSAVIAILVALFSASGGVNNLMTAINTAYDEEQTRSPIKKRLLALALTLGAIVFLTVMLALVAVVPPLVTAVFGDNPVIAILLQAVRWILLAALVTVALAILYRVAPERDAPKIRWVSVGAVAATVLWLLASIGFSIYVATFGNYAKTYGVFAGVIVLLFWLWITSYAILLGAEINAEAEEQTAADTTTGPAEPIGHRGAVKADSTPGDPTHAETAHGDTAPEDAARGDGAPDAGKENRAERS